MAELKITSNDLEEKEIDEDYENNDINNTSSHVTARELASRKERRKAAKKEKRKQKRKEMAEIARRDDEACLNDPEEQLRLQAEEEQEKARVEKELREFEERERKILEEWERKRADDEREEEERNRRAQEEEQLKQNQVGYADEVDEDGWEYVEEGPPEIIWQGNEIIVKKKKIRVKKKDADQQITKEDPGRPTSNPLPPHSELIADYNTTSVLSAQQLLENVAQETPNFGTEQDKAHCPFHLKTGACRFGSRCSRIHFYPDKSCTLLIKNMYNGPGLAWEQDEGLEHTDEEVKHAYEEFYDDVHTEFLKFGEIVNFKVSRNGSSHLRGNMYVHYKSLDSAVLAYQSVNGRYFAGKQVQCEFVGVTKWKVAICGEFMKSRFQACSRGTACNFIHCFRNPGGDYEWADWDKPAPKYWLKKMDALFGSPDKRHIERETPRPFRKSSRTPTDDVDRYHYRRSRSKEIDYSKSSRHYSEDDSRQRRHTTADRKHPEVLYDTSSYREKSHRKNVKSESQGGKSNRISIQEFGSDEFMYHSSRDEYRHNRHSSRSRRHKETSNDILDEGCDEDILKDSFQSTSTKNGQHNKGSTSPGDPDEYLEDKISFRQLNHNKSKHTSSRDHGSRRNGEIMLDSGNSRNYGWSRRTSDSSSRSGKHNSGKIGCDESERECHDRLKKSNRKRDADERGVSKSRIDCRKVKRSHATDDRGRWEPDGSDCSEHEELG